MRFSVTERLRAGHQTLQVGFTRRRSNPRSQGVQGMITPDEIPVSTVAILGKDFPGVRFELLVESGEAVSAGQAVMRDRRRRNIQFTSPVSGIVRSINRGPRRSLQALVIESVLPEIPAASCGEIHRVKISRKLLADTGVWLGFRTRPFGHIPDPESEPRAVFITAMDTRPGAPDTMSVLQHREALFLDGVKAVRSLFSGSMFLCCKPGDFDHLIEQLPDGVTLAEFSGDHPAGLPTTHIQALSPVGVFDVTKQPQEGRMTWHIDYQDVISIGQLKQTGSPWFRRVLAVSSPGPNARQLQSVPIGASKTELGVSAAMNPPRASHDNSEPSVRPERVHEQFAGYFERQVDLAEGLADDTSNRRYRSLVPSPRLDGAAPEGVLAVPFLRALLTGDIDSIRNLGGLELIEEDLDRLSAISSTGADYGVLLREALEQLHNEMYA